MTLDKKNLYELLNTGADELTSISHPWDAPLADLKERQLIAERIEELFDVLRWRFSFRDAQATEATIDIVEKELLLLLNELKERGTPPKDVLYFYTELNS